MRVVISCCLIKISLFASALWHHSPPPHTSKAMSRHLGLMAYGCEAEVCSSLFLAEKSWIPITEPTMLWVAPGWRPPPYPQALACALAAHAAHARARPRTRAHAALRPRTCAHVRARPRTPAHARARPRTSAHAALRGTAQVPSRSDSLTLRFPHAQIPCKGVPRYATGRDGVRSCGAGRGLVREGAGKCPRVWGWAPPWGYP